VKSTTTVRAGKAHVRLGMQIAEAGTIPAAATKGQKAS